MKNSLVIFAMFCRDNGFTLLEGVQFVGDNFDELDTELTNAYEDVYLELMQFANMQQPCT